ncbi:hypothetical protein JW826_00965 [Candidatus Woesearchaeota archaeon]|nr:hypothetical protein [Candidatus Woesearchaeota archaeon]
MTWYATVGLYIWDLFVDWIRTIFVLPFQTLDMLWLLVPVWLVWFFAEFFQEKRGTSMGNAISNAVVVLWGSIDCARQTTYWLAGHHAAFLEAFLRFGLIALIFSYGILIVWLGLRGNQLIKYIARIREVTYVFVMFVPIFYGATPLSWNHIIAAILFAPIFYFGIELLDRYIPHPKAVLMDIGSVAGKFGDSFSEKFGFDSGMQKEPPMQDSMNGFDQYSPAGLPGQNNPRGPGPGRRMR